MQDHAIILLAEDDPVDVMSVQRAFKKNQIENKLVTVKDGEEALDYLYRRGTFHDPVFSPIPSLILLDINMPRMNGFELLQVVKNESQFAYIPVIILTSSEDEVDVERAFRLQVAGYIVKPVEFDSFCQAISAIDRYWTLSMLP